MNGQKRVLQVIAMGLGVIMLCASAYITQPEVVQIEEESCALSKTAGTLVEQTQADINVIPDKYNTGAQGNLRSVTIGETVNGIEFVTGNNGTVNVLDFGYRNKKVTGTVVFENIDFSTYPIGIYNEDKVDRSIKVVFKNCMFSKFSSGKGKSNLSFEFENCTLNSFYGGNASFDRCQFGKSYKDGVIPFTNVCVNNSFFCDMASIDAEGAGAHTDGTQIYGQSGLDVENVRYVNCRFEIPAIQTTADAASVNACLMLQLEYSNAKDVEFSDCIVNGGGYTIYARDTGKGFTFTNVKFSNIQIGAAKLFGNLYPKVSEQIVFEKVGTTQNLYVGSVWKEKGKTHLSVSNDTNQERNLVVYADGTVYEYVVPACPDGSNLYASYDAFPFDMDIVIPDDCEYVVCYDNTLEGKGKQIRFVNWGSAPVYLNEKAYADIFGKLNASDEAVLEGMCGKDVAYSLSAEGVLTLSGTGATYNFHSSKPVPWSDYKYMIQKVVVEDGVEVLGTQIFKGCDNISEVVLGNSVKGIYSRAFQNCSTLATLTIPATIENIGEYAFYGTIIRNVTFSGNEDEWKSVEVGESNELLEKYIRFAPATVVEPETVIVETGKCGDDITYSLLEDGTLILRGAGATYNYHSGKTAPWYENKHLIKSIKVEEGITALGQQLFRRCAAVTDIQLPDSLHRIESNAFIQCSSMNQVTVPRNVVKIGKYAFAGTGLGKAFYQGTEAEWSDVVVEQYNDKLINNISCTIR